MLNTLTNLKPRGTTTMRYRPAETGKMVEVELIYDKGGMNYATYKNDPRGLYLRVCPIEIEKTEYGWSEKFTMFSGIRFFVFGPMKAKSDKTMMEVAAKLDFLTPELSVTFDRDGKTAVQALVHKKFGHWNGQTFVFPQPEAIVEMLPDIPEVTHGVR